MKKSILCSLLVAAASVSTADVAWTADHCAPADWAPLAGNVLAGLSGTVANSGSLSYLGSKNPDVVTDGTVPTAAGADTIVGFTAAAPSISWTFTAPKTLESVRVSCAYLGGHAYSGFTVSSVEVQTSGSSEWTALNEAAETVRDSGSADILSLSLADGSGDPLAENVAALRVTFGTAPLGFANYCVEIEAVDSTGALYPTLGTIDVTPGTNTATVAGTIVDVGADATACDVYLALDGGAATQIATGVTNSFEHQLTGLAEATEYAYVLCVSNNAPTAMGAERSGSFTTLDSTLPTVGWTTGHCAPADWTPLAGNVLAGLKGGSTSGGIYMGYSTNDPDLLTDGLVPQVGDAAEVKTQIVGFLNNASVEWEFSDPATIEQIRISCGYPVQYQNYSDVSVSSVDVKTSGSDTWATVSEEGVSFPDPGNKNEIQWVTLGDSSGDPLAANVVALRVKFGPVKSASYCCEIEAVSPGGALQPTLGTVNVTPAATSATVTGTILDPGAGATACDVYFALNGGTATRVAAGVTGAFEFPLTGLAEATEYAYVLSVSNNAATAKGAERSGSFTTLHASPPTASWTQGECNTADWSPLNRNILAGLTATTMYRTSTYASTDSTVLTDGEVPDSATTANDAQAGAVTVGFQSNGTIEWEFERRMTLKKIRLTSFWHNMLYNGISVKTVEVKYQGAENWTELYVPTVAWTGGTLLCQTETLSDAVKGHLAENVVALKLTFGAQKAAVANYYAEIEAVGWETDDFSLLLLR